MKEVSAGGAISDVTGLAKKDSREFLFVYCWFFNALGT
jgi:hypothetical protein